MSKTFVLFFLSSILLLSCVISVEPLLSVSFLSLDPNDSVIGALTQNAQHLIPEYFLDFIPKNTRQIKWPSDYYFDNPNIDKLTGYEQPLRHLGIMPFPLEEIDTKFRLYANWSKAPDKYLYDISYNNESSLRTFPLCSKVYVFVHGWTPTALDDPLTATLIKTIVSNQRDSCLVAVLWRRGVNPFSLQAISSNFAHQTVYFDQVVNAIVVGRQTAYLLFLLTSRGKISSRNLHVIGHSLGAQVVHFVGQYYTTLAMKFQRVNDDDDDDDNPRVGVKIGRITGLDPPVGAFDGYQGAHLVPEDANFVDLIRVALDYQNDEQELIGSAEQAFERTSGHVTFLPNGGTTPQPNCVGLMPLADPFGVPFIILCSHFDTIRYMSDSFDRSLPREKFLSVNCPSFDMINECMRTASPSMFGSMGRDAEKFPGRGFQHLRYKPKPMSVP